jgi:uracil-DNA glycosylase
LQQLVASLQPRVFLALGQIAWQATVDELKRLELAPARLPKFGHGTVAGLADGRALVGSYHPSQQNTFTGRLTEPMFDRVFEQICELLK